MNNQKEIEINEGELWKAWVSAIVEIINELYKIYARDSNRVMQLKVVSPNHITHINAIKWHIEDWGKAYYNEGNYRVFKWALDKFLEYVDGNPRRTTLHFTVPHGWISTGYKMKYVFAITMQKTKNGIVIKPNIIATRGYYYRVLPV